MKHILPGEPIPPGSLFHERRYRVALKLGAGIPHRNILLDIGCGNGSQTEFFASHVDQVVGIDLQVTRLKGYQKDLQIHQINNMIFMGSDGEQLPIKENQFDYVTCFEVLEHVREQEKALSEIFRVLKSGGVLFMSLPHRWWIFETHGANLPLLPWNRVPFFSWLPKRWHDAFARARNYRRAEIQRLLSQAGFIEIRTELLTAPMDVVENDKIQKLLRKFIFIGDTNRIPFLASNIFVNAKKST